MLTETKVKSIDGGKMIRKIIRIDKEKCNGCGVCADACHEGAIDIINGKAELVREHFCDGLGDCLPECPTGAISFEEREAPEYDEEAVKEAQKKIFAKNQAMTAHAGCPGSKSMQIQRKEASETETTSSTQNQVSKLQNWPVQIKLAPVNAPYFNGAKLLIAADCTAYAYAGFHQDFIRNKVTLIGCPKLDQVDYSEKLTAIIQNNDIQSVTIVRMEVPCCGGLEMATKKALQNSGKFIPWQVITIGIDGNIIE
jgi:ferredoxin